jgi:hypothetical protein
MMNGAGLRAHSAAWQDRAERESDGEAKLRFERIARNWASLAAIAEAEEAREVHRRRGGR